MCIRIITNRGPSCQRVAASACLSLPLVTPLSERIIWLSGFSLLGSLPYNLKHFEWIVIWQFDINQIELKKIKEDWLLTKMQYYILIIILIQLFVSAFLSLMHSCWMWKTTPTWTSMLACWNWSVPPVPYQLLKCYRMSRYSMPDLVRTFRLPFFHWLIHLFTVDVPSASSSLFPAQ